MKRIHRSSMIVAYDYFVNASRRITIVILAVFIVAAAALALWYLEHQRSTNIVGGIFGGASQNAAYSNPQFGYSLTYPSNYQAQQLAPEFVTIGSSQNGSIEGMANVAVLHAQKTEPLPSADAFVRLVAQLACNQNGGSTPVHCTSIAQSSPFTTGSGAAGQEMYFDSNAGKRGPFYAFDISSKVSGEYAVLLVYPPPNLAQSDADRALLQGIAQSIQLH